MPSNQPILLHFHATSTMMPLAPPAVAPPPGLRQNWETLARLALLRSKPPDVDAYPHTVFICSSVLRRKPTNLLHLVLRPKPRNCHSDFVGQITKPYLQILRPKPEILSDRFWGQNTRTIAIGFKIKPGKTVDRGFEAELRNPCSSSSCAQCRPHTMLPDLSMVRPPSTQTLLDHPQSSAPSLLLLPRSLSLSAMPYLSPTHHETSKHISPHKTDSIVEPPKFLGFKFKPR
jgi:hypothetical protein